MSFPRYPSYKASNVEWLGEVPEHWTVWKVSHLFRASKGKNGQMLTKEFCAENEGEYPVYSGQTENEGVMGTWNQFEFEFGDQGVLFSTTVGSGKVMTLKHLFGRFSLSQNCMVIWPTSELCLTRFYFYHFQPLFEFQRGLIPQHMQASFRMEDLYSYRIARPRWDEQVEIATFLDRETAKIDALVAEQRRLMELLKEKRQAVISHAVTQGLNPNVPMKPSGIEWLGGVPAHWEVLPLKRIVSTPITDGPHETPQFIDEGVPFVSAEAVSSGLINFSKVRACISEEDNARYSLKYFPKLHDIYMVKSGATTGITAIVEDRTDFNIWSPLAAIRCNNDSVPHFVLNFMRSRHFLEAVTLNWSFGTQQNIGMGVIENLACTVPPLEEQVKIVQFLKKETVKFDVLIAEAQRAIDLLQERRTALISAAVTGKIDVRTLTERKAA